MLPTVSVNCYEGGVPPMNSNLNLQAIIGTDKRNPKFTICRASGSRQTDRIYVFYGAELFDNIIKDKNNPEFKLMIARMFNARVKQIALEKEFGIARATMAR